VVTTSATFAGWFRRGQGEPWVKMTEAEDYGVCWSALLDRRPAVNCELLVAEATKDPNPTKARPCSTRQAVTHDAGATA
jgi:hypothetical protein